MKPSDCTAVIPTRGDVDLTEILDSLTPVGFHEIIVWANNPFAPGHLFAFPDATRGTQIDGVRGRQIVTKANWDTPVVVWIAETDVAVYGRYAAAAHAKTPYVYTQDDDCIIPAADVLRRADELADETQRAHGLDPTSVIVANMPESRWADYPDSCLVGWGSVFHRDLPEVAWKRWSASGAPASLIPHDFNRTCDVVFTTLVPHTKVDVGFQHLPWAEDPARAMFLQPQHRPERERALELARAARSYL